MGVGVGVVVRGGRCMYVVEGAEAHGHGRGHGLGGCGSGACGG